MSEPFDRITAFNEQVGRVFADLLKHHPSPAMIQYSRELPKPFLDTEEYHIFLRDTVAWLLTNGLIHSHGISMRMSDPQGTVYAGSAANHGNRFTLTPLALQALNVQIEALGMTVRQAAEQGRGLDQVGGTISHLLGRFASGFVDGRM